MKMISNDLRSSARALLLGAYQEGGGGTYRNSIFHDILDNSDVVTTIPIYGDYKITVNIWETDRPEAYGVNARDSHCSAQRSEEDWLCQNYFYTEKRVFPVYVAWNGDIPLYAQIGSTSMFLSRDYNTIEVYENKNTIYPYTWYAYLSSNNDYIKGSAVLTSEIDHFEFQFHKNYFDDYIYACDSSGNHVSLQISFKVKHSSYGSERTSTTEIPTIKLSSSSEDSYGLSTTSIHYFTGTSYGVFSDFATNEELIAAHGEIVRAICLANGIDYQMAPLLTPESEE